MPATQQNLLDETDKLCETSHSLYLPIGVVKLAGRVPMTPKSIGIISGSNKDTLLVQFDWLPEVLKTT